MLKKKNRIGCNYIIHRFTLRNPSKLLDKRFLPSVENFTEVISSLCAFSTYISGLLPHPGLRFQICKRINDNKIETKKIEHYKGTLSNTFHSANKSTNISPQMTINTCIDPSPMPPAIHFPSRSQAQIVTATLPGLASFGLITYP